MPLRINRLGGALGAEVTGIDLASPLGNRDFDRIHQAFLDHSVVVVRDQKLDPDQFLAFSRRFGEPIEHVLEGYRMEEKPEVFVVSNVKEDGKPKGAIYAGQYWHSDLSYMKEPALGSMLYALEIPPVGGDTLYANLYLAYETLSGTMKALIEDLRAVHDYTHAYETVFSKLPNRPPITKAQKAQVPPVDHPIVRTHPETGRKALFVNPGFTCGIVGMTEQESQAILDFLFAHATRPEFMYRHVWRQRDVVLWDNRCLMHRAVANYDMDEARHMHRSTIAGDAPY
jgi:taurine dioxygenase